MAVHSLCEILLSSKKGTNLIVYENLDEPWGVLRWMKKAILKGYVLYNFISRTFSK